VDHEIPRPHRVIQSDVKIDVLNGDKINVTTADCVLDIYDAHAPALASFRLSTDIVQAFAVIVADTIEALHRIYSAGHGYTVPPLFTEDGAN
jgi:hypothetical protein